MTRLTTDVDALNELFTSGFVALLGDVAVLGGIVAILFALDTTLARSRSRSSSRCSG